MPPSRSKAPLRLLLAVKIFLAGLITFVLLEGLLLVFNDRIFRRSFYMYEPEFGFQVRPGFEWGIGLKTNEFGFNDRDYPHERTPGTCRALVLGDSFNWAEGPNGNYAAILEERLAQELGSGRAEVVNAGYSATHTAEQLPVLRKYGLQYHPDLALLGFFVGNDFVDAMPWRRSIIYGDTFVKLDTRTKRETVVLGQPLLLRSRLAGLIRWQWLLPRPQMTGPESRVPMYPLSRQDFLSIEHDRMAFGKAGSEEAYAERAAHIFKALQEMQALLKERQVEFVIAAFPDVYQVDPELRKAVLDRFGEKAPDYDWDRGQDLLRGFSAVREIEFIDLLPAFVRAHEEGERLYHPNETHWNASGNRLAAQVLLEPVLRRCEPKIRSSSQGAEGPQGSKR